MRAQSPISLELTTRRSTLAAAIAQRVSAKLAEVTETAALHHAYSNLAALADAIDVDAPELFADTVGWNKSVDHHRAGSSALHSSLQTMREVLAESLPNSARDVAVSYVELALERWPAMETEPAACIDPRAPLYQLAQQYLDALLRGERSDAARLVEAAIARGSSVHQIYLDVFQQAQYEIGRLWQMNRISVAQEHYVTAATQLIMARLYPKLFTAPSTGRTLLATGASLEAHDLGIRMVSDFFELSGWNSIYLGADMPPHDLVQMAQQRQPDVIAISATLLPHVRHAREMIAVLKSHDRTKEIPVLVGGYPFRVTPGLFSTIGATATAADAPAAVQVAATLV